MWRTSHPWVQFRSFRSTHQTCTFQLANLEPAQNQRTSPTSFPFHRLTSFLTWTTSPPTSIQFSTLLTRDSKKINSSLKSLTRRCSILRLRVDKNMNCLKVTFLLIKDWKWMCSMYLDCPKSNTQIRSIINTWLITPVP